MADNNNNKQYVLSRKGRFRNIYLSRPDYKGVEWYAKQQNISVTAAIHLMIIEFLTPKLAVAQLDVLNQGVKKSLLHPSVLTQPLKRLLRR